jgi:hypothetical protein
MTTAAKLTALIAAGRIVAGFALVAAPGRSGAAWLGGVAERPATRLGLRGLGARDIALGAGTLAVLDDSDRLRHWVASSAACDLADAVGALATPSDALPAGARWATVAVGGGAAFAGALLHRALD